MIGGESNSGEIVVPVVPVVEISRGQHTRGTSAGHEDNINDHGMEDYAYDYDEDDFEEINSPRHHPQPQPRYKAINGKHKIDMTPPDQKLVLSENAAKRFASTGKVDKAIEEYIKCVAFSRIVYGASHWKHALSVVNLGEAYLNLKAITFKSPNSITRFHKAFLEIISNEDYHAQAEYHADTAHSIMLHGSHTGSSLEEKAELYSVLIKIYRIMGQALTALKKYSDAEQALQKADKISQERSRMSCVSDRECDQLDILLFHAMARLYAKQKKYALASEKYDKVVDLMEKEYGTDSFQVMEVYKEYGKLEQSKGRHANHDKAIRMFLQAHSIASAIFKEGSSELIDTALALSQAYASTGWEEAEGSALSYLEESLSMCTAVHGPNHAKTLEVQDHLAKMLIRTDRMDEAMQILKSSLPVKCKVFSDYSEPVSDTYKLMGSIHLSESNIERALRSYKKCHTIEAVLLGKNHRKTKDTEKTMEMLMASPSVSHKFVLNKQDELQKRPRFNSVVGRSK